MTDVTMAPQALMQIGTGHYVAVSCLLFTIGFCGVALNRKNLIVILMSVELMLLAVNLNFAAFSAHLHDKAGQVFVIFILTIAAAEAAVGLAILVAAYRNVREIAVERMSVLKG